MPLPVAPGALLMAALLVYFAEGRYLAALLPAVLAHELGHLLALRLLGLRTHSLRAETTGLRIDYTGDGGVSGELLAAAAGPAAGLCWAWAASRLGERFGWETARLSAGLSLLLSFFNLLPAAPLDGGRIAAAVFAQWPGGKRGERMTRLFGFATALALCVSGLYLFARGKGPAALMAGGMLLAEQMKREKR